MAIAHAAWVYRGCAHRGVHLELLNVGGGLPAHYREPIQPLDAYAETIETALNREFRSARPRIIIDPRRYLDRDAGLLRTEYCLSHANLCVNESAVSTQRSSQAQPAIAPISCTVATLMNCPSLSLLGAMSILAT
jgi:diaminopimelate decarboxylase